MLEILEETKAEVRWRGCAWRQTSVDGDTFAGAYSEDLDVWTAYNVDTGSNHNWLPSHISGTVDPA